MKGRDDSRSGDPSAVGSRNNRASARRAPSLVVRWMFGLGLAVLTMSLLYGGLSLAQSGRASCAVLTGLDLKALLGADHGVPVPFGDEACRAESHSPGRMVVLTVSDKPAVEIKSWMAMVRKMNATQRAQEVNVIAEPSLGPDAFSVREKAPTRGVEIYAQKNNHAVVVQADWSIGPPIGDAVFSQLRQVASAAVAKLP